MTIKEILTETFVDYYKFYNKQFPVYKNPTSNEIRDLVKETKSKGLRWLVDIKTKDVYVFSDKIMHYIAWSKMNNINDPKVFNKVSIRGHADNRGKIKKGDGEDWNKRMPKGITEKEVLKIAKKGNITL
ncbi:MAG: hypothetical protein DRJ01_00650 [Bacteroidetes bacterium]|nr:MAG: hypothetical protein DRJ01_00650 [Bacteroidota bacterium]